MRVEDVSGFYNFGCVLDESGTDETECGRKGKSRVAGTIRSLVKARSLQLECAIVLRVIASACSYVC